ncbi:hypothetical protein FORMB_25330 [Formosa sp. Hel1_33_131]|uniref:terminase gpP N-terminus-related DNA-binding protein n=1 Tax=Formosa sp. Hel1_33_131 TaxID=1336794 RepID=UPI00084E211F|nr:hypothetical protein [Formosa sp. Hel1_33_131]AOR29550.1 hypothetical protein FORMB_25330 [Formosa sp. Hel1_33_131]
MAKEKEKQLARIYYIEQGKTAKWIAVKLSLTEKTVGSWIAKYGWKELRNAKENGIDKRIDNIKEVIDDIIEDRSVSRTTLNKYKLDLVKAQEQKDQGTEKAIKEQISEVKREIVGFDDAISKWNKTLENFDKENKVSLSNYIHVMEEVFKDLLAFDSKLYKDTLDFQDQHINKVSITIG